MPIERSIEIPVAVYNPLEALKGPNKLSNPSIPPFPSYSPVLRLSQSLSEAGFDKTCYRRSKARPEVQTGLTVDVKDERGRYRLTRRGSRGRSSGYHGSGRSRRAQCHRCGEKHSSVGISFNNDCKAGSRLASLKPGRSGQSRIPTSKLSVF